MLDLKKITKSIHRKANGIQDPRIMHANRDWWIAILIFIFLNILGGLYLWSIHLSYYVSAEISESLIETEIYYQAELVEIALQVVVEKQKVFESFTDTNTTPIVNMVEDVVGVEDIDGEEVEEVLLFEEIEEDINPTQ